MATWILFNSSERGIPVISAMAGSELVENLETSSKMELVTFLNRFDRAGTFFVARVDEGVESTDLLAEDVSFITSLNALTSADTYRFFRDGNGKPVVVAMSGTEPVEIFRGNRKDKLINFLNNTNSKNVCDR